MTVLSPEPESGNWPDVDLPEKTALDKILNKQLPWEWQYLKLCDITAFWLPTYWNEEKSEPFDPNIGPTTRWEFGYYLQEYLKSPHQKKFILGGPDDADGIKWARRKAEIHGIQWHSLPIDKKDKLVADSFIEEIAQSLIDGKWAY